MEERRKDYQKIIDSIEQNGSGLISLKEYFNEKLTAIEKTQQLALTLAKEHLDRRLEEMNNFRRDMQRMEGSFMTKIEFDSKHEMVSKDIVDLRLSRAELQGKASQLSVNIALLFSALGVIIGIIKLFR